MDVILQGRYRLALAVIAVFALSACGGGGGGGGDDDSSGTEFTGQTSAASIDDPDTANDLARASGEGTSRAQAQGSVPQVFGVAIDGGARDAVVVTSREAIENASDGDIVSGAEIPNLCNSGSADLTEDSSTSTSQSGTITYDNCVVGVEPDTVRIDGTVEFSSTVDGDTITALSLSYNNLRVTVDGVTQTLNGTVSCTDAGGLLDCQFSEDFTGTDGRIYRVANVSVTETSGGYDISARVFHPAHGYVDIVTNTPLTFECDNGLPDSGEVQFSDSLGNVVVVTFIDCTQFSVNYNGATTVVEW